MFRYLCIPARRYNFNLSTLSNFSSFGIENVKEKILTNETSKKKNKSGLITPSLLNTINKDSRELIDNDINSAKNINDLLTFSNHASLNKKNVLHILSIINDWTINKKINISQYQNDPRFLNLTKVLNENKTVVKEERKEFENILGNEDESQFVHNLNTYSVSQMIKLLLSMTIRKKRSPPILRTISYNILQNPYKLLPNEIGDIFYALAILHFPDEPLLQKASNDLVYNLRENTPPFIIKSILTSVGHLKYKNTQLLDCLSNWIHNNLHKCSTREVLSLIITLATVGYIPSNEQALFQALKPLLVEQEMSSSMEWLQMVWSLAILGKCSEEQINNVLSKDFIHKLRVSSFDNEIPIPAKLKLINLNGYAKIIKEYKGPLLDLSSEEWQIPLTRSKVKSTLVSSILNTFSNLISSEVYLKTNIDTKMGFFLDAECCLDDKLNPLPLKGIEKKGNDSKKCIRIGILVWDYNDLCIGSKDLGGICKLYKDLLSLQGYQILEIPYTEFSPREKILTRVKYLENKLREIVQSSQNPK